MCRHLCTTLLLSAAYLSFASPQRWAPFGSGDGSVSVTKSRGQSEVKAPSSLLTSESLAWPSQLLQTPTQQKGVGGLAQGERAAKGKEKDMLSQMRFVWKVPSWQHGWLLHLDIMGPLIYSVPVLLCDCGHFIARSINRGIHHRLHHHHPCQHHMIAWWCFPSLCYSQKDDGDLITLSLLRLLTA